MGRNDGVEPPDLERKPVELTMHGHTRIDNYYWLRERDNPEVIAYLEAENRFTQGALAHTEGLQESLYEEMVGRIQETDQTVPEGIDDYFYYSRTEKDKEYRIYCRKHGSADTVPGSNKQEEVLLDLNVLAEGQEYLNMGIYKVSPNHNVLAYSLDTDGSEEYTIYFKNLQTGERWTDEIRRTDYSAEWANDSRTLFYTTFDEAKRSDKVWRHKLGSDSANDELLFHESDELFRVFLYKTKDQRYIVQLVRSLETSEAHTLNADRPDGEFALIQERSAGVRYHAEHHDGRFFIVTNLEATNFKLVTAPVDAPGQENWREFLAHRDSVKIDDIELFAGHLVVYERKNGLRAIRITDLQSNETHYVEFPEPVYTFADNSNPEFHTEVLRFTYQSLTTSQSVYDYNMVDASRELRKQEPVKGYDPRAYCSERIFAQAEDGAQIPISLVYRADCYEAGRPMPCLLYGYGSYGYCIDPGFSSSRVSLLDRGVIWVIAHVRGGEEMGRTWYEQGKFLHKRNTFSDFIACARRLIDEKYTDSDRLAIMGRSAGGLLIGAVLNMAPELFSAAVAGVPFVDVLTTMLDESIPLTVGEFEEWGNPKDPEYYHYMLSYSPYDNVAARTYPDILVTAGLNDPRVQYWEPAKWVARLRDSWAGNNRLLLKTEMGAGHAGPSGRYESLREVALYYAFVLDALAVPASGGGSSEYDRA